MGVAPVFQDRGRLACISGSRAFQDRKHFVWCFFRFAGGMPAIRLTICRYKNSRAKKFDPQITQIKKIF
ncbi:MAG: hypothetical protein LBP59_02520 [Planctomycetaceae bacterium]|jgi:hypothetical protein|nr:hypothetical protein [Planctomycetaceae bacterium]